MPPPAPREWSPRLWEGMDYFAFLRLMLANRLRVEPRYAYIAAIMSVVTFGNTLLGWVQAAREGGAIARTPRPRSPVFVLGHWRTGTTLVHELLMLDGRFTTPTTHDCFLPCHALLSADFVQNRLAFLMPKTRPMDAMPAGWERPQEDEFALALLGEPSTYTDIAFPNNPPLSPGALDLSGLTARERCRWQRTLDRFLRTLQSRDPRRLVLKSPPHTARLPELLELFPDAKFVHLTRDPFTLFASTRNLWLQLARAHGLQTPHAGPALDAKVFREFRTLTERYLVTRHLIPAGHLVELRYEDLVRDLPAGMAAIYEGLDLGEYDRVRPHVEAYAERTRDYAPNQFALGEAERAAVAREWGDLIARLGYAVA